MNQKKTPQLLDLVAVLSNAGQSDDVEIGDVGTVVELLPLDGAEIEFLDRSGRTRCIATFPVADILVLNRDRTAVG